MDIHKIVHSPQTIHLDVPMYPVTATHPQVFIWIWLTASAVSRCSKMSQTITTEPEVKDFLNQHHLKNGAGMMDAKAADQILFFAVARAGY